MRSFKLLMLASTEFHVFKPVLLALPLSQGDRDVRKVKQFVFSLQVLSRPKLLHVLHGSTEMCYWFIFLPFLCWSKSRIVWSTCISQIDVSGEGFKIFLVIFRSDRTPDHSHARGMWDVLEWGRGGHSLIRGPGVRTGDGGAAGSVGSDAHAAASGVRRRTASFAGTDLCPFFMCFFMRVECRCMSVMLHVECMIWGVEGGGSILGICSDLPAIQSSGAVWKSKWPSWAFHPDEPYSFCGHKAILNCVLPLVKVCPLYVNRHLRTWSSTSSSSAWNVFYPEEVVNMKSCAGCIDSHYSHSFYHDRCQAKKS